LRALYDYPRTLSLAGRRRTLFLHAQPGLLDQPILYVQAGPDGEPGVLIDPNTLSGDGTTALTAYFPSPDGRRVAYALSVHGSDRQEIGVREVGEVREVQEVPEVREVLRFVKFASLAWTRDGSGFYYLRFPEPGTVPPEDEQYYGRIYFHRLGDAQADDSLVFAHPEREVVPLVHVSSSGRWVVITAQRGASDDSEVHVVACPPTREARRREDGGRRGEDGNTHCSLRRLRCGVRVRRGSGRTAVLQDDEGCADGTDRVGRSGESPGEAGGMREVVAESPDRLSHVVMARGRLVASYLHDASDRLRVFALDGSPAGNIPLPGIGSIVTLDAEPEDDEVRLVFTSFVDPPRPLVFRLTADATPMTFRGFDLEPERLSEYRTAQVWYPSKDGTRISMFLVHRRTSSPTANGPCS
jgi:prolyl oligopeptidase